LECKDQVEAFQNFPTTYKTLFWHIFGYGDSDDANLFVRSINITEQEKIRMCDPVLNVSQRLAIIEEVNKTHNGSLLLERNHQPTEFMGYAILGIYHIIAVIVLLNILIAMLNSNYAKIQQNSDVEWKFRWMHQDQDDRL
jgi:hypothetical protein